MTTETFKFNVGTAYGQTLPNPVPVSGSYEAYESYDELAKNPKDLPDNDEILNFVNAKRKAAARASATTSALQGAGYKKPTLEDENVQIQTMARVFKARGDSQEVAEQKARATLGL